MRGEYQTEKELARRAKQFTVTLLRGSGTSTSDCSPRYESMGNTWTSNSSTLASGTNIMGAIDETGAKANNLTLPKSTDNLIGIHPKPRA